MERSSCHQLILGHFQGIIVPRNTKGDIYIGAKAADAIADGAEAWLSTGPDSLCVSLWWIQFPSPVGQETDKTKGQAFRHSGSLTHHLSCLVPHREKKKEK